MEIETGTLITGAIFTVIIFGTLGLLVRLGKRRTQKVKKLLSQTTKLHNLNTDVEDIWNDKGLALDSATHTLVYVNRNSDPIIVSINEATGVDLIGKEKELIQIIIHFINHQVALNLFEIEKDDPVEIGFHQVLAKKWVQIIRNSVQRPKGKRAFKKAA